jgi:hypothetical protein
VQTKIKKITAYVKDILTDRTRKVTLDYSIYDFRKLQQNINLELDMYDLEEQGLKVSINTSKVELAEEMKTRLKDDREKKEKFKDLVNILKGTPFENLHLLFSNVDDFKKYLFSEVKNQKSYLDSLKSKLVKGEIDEVQYKRAISILGNNQVLGEIIHSQHKQLEPRQINNKEKSDETRTTLSKVK